MDLPDVRAPHIRLTGEINKSALDTFLSKLDDVLATDADPIVLESMTSGGDAEYGRRIALEVRLFRSRCNRQLVFIGKTQVFSAGVTIMAGFPRDARFLSEDTVLLIHGRQYADGDLLKGPVAVVIESAKAKVAQLEKGIALENEGYKELIAGSDVSLEEIQRRARTDWYLRAAEALERKLIAGMF